MNKHRLTPMKFRPINPKIVSNKVYTDRVDAKIYSTGQPINKYWTFDFIETISDYIDFNEIKTIFDVGSRDGYQSVEFRQWFPDSRIVAFEANPNQIPLCINTTKNHNIEIVPKAAGNENGETTFFIASNNVGASSLLKNANHPRSNNWPQTKVTVDMVRIDDWCKENKVETIDLLWMDVQGAEKIVLDGCGDLLNKVKAICTEVEIDHMYEGSILKGDLDSYLLDRGFVELQTFHMGNREIQSLSEISKTIGECDVIYINKNLYGEI